MLALAALLAAAVAGAAAHSAPIDAQDPMDQLHDLMRDPGRRRQLVPPEIMERFGGAPEWTRQTAEEREEHLRQHVRSENQRDDRPKCTK